MNVNPTLSQIQCPKCQKQNTWHVENAFRPFCSERCRLMDLGDWASESNRLPTQETPDSEPEEN